MAEFQAWPRQDKLCIWRMLNEIWGVSWWLFEPRPTAWTDGAGTDFRPFLDVEPQQET